MVDHTQEAVYSEDIYWCGKFFSLQLLFRSLGFGLISQTHVKSGTIISLMIC